MGGIHGCGVETGRCRCAGAQRCRLRRADGRELLGRAVLPRLSPARVGCRDHRGGDRGPGRHAASRRCERAAKRRPRCDWDRGSHRRSLRAGERPHRLDVDRSRVGRAQRTRCACGRSWARSPPSWPMCMSSTRHPQPDPRSAPPPQILGDGAWPTLWSCPAQAPESPRTRPTSRPCAPPYPPRRSWSAPGSLPLTPRRF